MALGVTCARCGKSYRVAEGMAGKRLKCSACEGVMAVAMGRKGPATW
jgi:hypothetical protein